MPLSELIKPPQYIQFICIGQCAGWGERHKNLYAKDAWQDNQARGGFTYR